MYAFTSFTWLDHAQRALRFNRPKIALFCLGQAMRHAQRERRYYAAGKILAAINYAKQV